MAGIAYTAIEKGSGYVYAAENQLYHRVRTAGTFFASDLAVVELCQFNFKL